MFCLNNFAKVFCEAFEGKAEYAAFAGKSESEQNVGGAANVRF